MYAELLDAKEVVAWGKAFGDLDIEAFYTRLADECC
jgi:hypothetical protein